MEEELIVETAQKALAQGIDPYDAIEQGLSDGMARAGRLFEEEEYFIPELLICSDAMYAGLDLLKLHLKKSGESKGKVVIGVIEGDTHDIGDAYAANAAEAVKVARELVGPPVTA